MSFLNEIKKLLNEVITETDGLGVWVPDISDEDEEDENSEGVGTQDLIFKDLERVSSDIVEKFSNAIAEGKKLEGEDLQETLSTDMGIIKANHINEIQKVAVTTSKGKFTVQPFDVMALQSSDEKKGEQQENQNKKTNGP